MSREMKDSGVEWIGEIPKDWKYVRLKYFYEFEKGKNAAVYTQEYIGKNVGDYPVYSGQTENEGIMGKINSYDYDVDECLFTTTVGAKVMTPKVLSGRFSLSQNCLIMKQIKKCNNKYFYYILLSLFDYEKSLIPKYMQPSLRIEDLNKYVFYIPNISEQQKIANFLDERVGEIDRFIDNAKKSIEEYKKYKQSVITEAVTKGLNPNIEMKDSGIEWIGKIPKDWKIIKMNRLIVSTQNGLSRRNLNNSIGKIVLKLSNMTIKGTIDYSCVNRIDLSDKEIEIYGLQEGDFLFVRVNGSKSLVGKCAIYSDIGEEVAFNDHIIRVKVNKFCNKKYFLWYLLSNPGRKEINTHITTAAGQFTINGKSLRDLNISLPSIEEQEKIVNYLDLKCIEIDNIISKKEQLISELELYKKSIIYEYVTGKKQVIY